MEAPTTPKAHRKKHRRNKKNKHQASSQSATPAKDISSSIDRLHQTEEVHDLKEGGNRSTARILPFGEEKVQTDFKKRDDYLDVPEFKSGEAQASDQKKTQAKTGEPVGVMPFGDDKAQIDTKKRDDYLDVPKFKSGEAQASDQKKLHLASEQHKTSSA
jgi:hypothetical protein